MKGYLYMEDRGEGSQRFGTPVTPARKEQAPANRDRVVPRSLIALDKAALGVSEDWRERIALRCARRKESSVRVVARLRPPSKEELEAEGRDCERAFRVSKDRCVEALEGPQTWEFDVAFGEDCSQEAVYNAAGRPVIDGLVDGYNGTIFAYGQTGSGKTHCMFGPSHEVVYQASDSRGIVPRAAQHVFNHIRDGTDGAEFVLRCSLFEVYREQLRDLLDPANPNLRIKETPRQGVFVDGLAQEFVACEDDVVRLLRSGSRLRAVAATRLNQHSSRSHVIFSLTCEQRLVDGTEKLAKLNLVDLAGSEKVWKSSSSGVTLEEAKKINLSLSALGNVISALASHRGHVPYRNSKLTRILQETLGGNFKTALVVTCSPLRMHLDETQSSLHFATRAKAVCNHVKVNFVYSAEQLMAFVERLQEELLMTRREITKHGGGPIPVSFPEAPVACDVAAARPQLLHWDAPSPGIDTTCGPSPSPAPRPKKKHGRLLSLAAETKPVLLKALVAQEELIGEMKAVRGTGLAHELRSLAAGLVSNSGCTSARQPCQNADWETLCIRQCKFHKLVQSQDLARQLAAQHRSWKGLEGRREVLGRYRHHLDAQLAKVALDLQSAREALACEEGEGRGSRPPSRGHSPRAKRTSAASDASVILQGAGRDFVANLEEGGAQSSSAPNLASHSRHSVGDAETETEAVLRRELEMLKVDTERQAEFHRLITQQTALEHSRWYEWAHMKLADLDHSEEQTLCEEQRLRELLERRQSERTRKQEKVAQLQLEVLAKKHERRITVNSLDIEISAAERVASVEDVRIWSKCKELDYAISRVREKRDLQEARGHVGRPWPELGA